MTTRLRFLTFPRNDAAFAAQVEDASGRLDPTDAPSTEKLDELLAELRSAYPQIEIRQQDGLASFDSVPLTWYVYRDGASNR